jgi:cation diffusion facilitator CzcD-associated flavoprotein CzcO
MTDSILDALVLGAGFAGIGAAIKLKEAGITNFVVVEKNDSVGGTWYENTYPGAACDVPSHLIQIGHANSPRK